MPGCGHGGGRLGRPADSSADAEEDAEAAPFAPLPVGGLAVSLTSLTSFEGVAPPPDEDDGSCPSQLKKKARLGCGSSISAKLRPRVSFVTSKTNST
mmetsp:Transcript_73086/g.191601  ORF Transcript_73086/g.191601 Transcript_73086/m.191601 type:complete len:97 (+) Transcript_73086:288-578(+)